MKKYLLLILLSFFYNQTSFSQERLRDLGIEIGVLPTGEYNSITDVEGVKVGHSTLHKGDSVRTGVTAILPHGGNIFQQKFPAAIYVGNGFGKLAGSGDYVIAFSAAEEVRIPYQIEGKLQRQEVVPNGLISPLFMAAIEATEEAILNSLFMAKTSIGRDGHKIEALPKEKVLAILEKYNVIKKEFPETDYCKNLKIVCNL